MRIQYSYRDEHRVFETPAAQIVLGRPTESETVDFDLEPDLKVSRRHGRIWIEDGKYWVEDLGSTRGTSVNNVEIKGRGPQPLRFGDTVCMGETTLTVLTTDQEAISSNASSPDSSNKSNGTKPVVDAVKISKTLDANATNFAAVGRKNADTVRRLELLYELPLQFAAETRLETMLEITVERLTKIVPGATNGALLLSEPGSKNLLLKACQSCGDPTVSETLARRAMSERKAFIWKRGLEADLSGSVVQQKIETGIYAPLLWQGEALGAICVDNSSPGAAFTDEALRLVLIVAQYAAMAIASHQLQERLRLECSARTNLMRQFSPRVAERLLKHRGRLQLGGERSEVTILCADIRGFTKMATGMEADEVVEMLNECFAYLVPVIFSFQGTVDKYIGDAVLAIFGSPEQDPEHSEKALRSGLEMQLAMAKLNSVRGARKMPPIEIGIGIHRGEVVHGFIGTADRMEFTAIGDAVNRASRYCAGAKAGEIVISPELHERVWKLVETQRIVLATKHEGESVAYRVKCLRESSNI
jgi:adenylate cyclase